MDRILDVSHSVDKDNGEVGDQPLAGNHLDELLAPYLDFCGVISFKNAPHM